MTSTAASSGRDLLDAANRHVENARKLLSKRGASSKADTLANIRSAQTLVLRLLANAKNLGSRRLAIATKFKGNQRAKPLLQKYNGHIATTRRTHANVAQHIQTLSRRLRSPSPVRGPRTPNALNRSISPEPRRRR
jgi:hypothetical protein